MPFFSSLGREIYYERHGTGPARVFLHGAGSNAATWWQQLAAFQHDHTCLTMDLRCFGRSAAPLDEFRLDCFVQDVLRLLDAQGLEQATLIGQSLGGMIALHTAWKHPQRVHSLVLCDTSMAIDHPRQLHILRERLTRAAALSIEQRSLGQWFLQHRPQLAVLYAQINHFNPNVYLDQKDAWQRALQGLHDADQLMPLSALDTIRCPALIVVGEHDPIVPVDIMQDVQARITGCDLRVIAQAAHSAYFEQPEAFNEALAQFFARL